MGRETRRRCAGRTTGSARRRSGDKRGRQASGEARKAAGRSATEVAATDRLRRVPMPSAASSTSAPGHSSREAPSTNGPDANASPGSSVSVRETR